MLYFYTNRKDKKIYQYYLKNSRFDRLALMHKKENAAESYKDCIRAIGAPNKTVTDNDQVLTGTK